MTTIKALKSIKHELQVLLLEAEGVGVIPDQNIIHNNIKGLADSPIGRAVIVFKNSVNAILDAANKILEMLTHPFGHMESATGPEKGFITKIVSLVQQSIKTLSTLVRDNSVGVTAMLIGFSIASAIIVMGYALAYYLKNKTFFLTDIMSDLKASVMSVKKEVEDSYDTLLDNNAGTLATRIYKFVSKVIAAPFLVIYSMVEKSKDKKDLEMQAIFAALFLAIAVGLSALVYAYSDEAKGAQ